MVATAPAVHEQAAEPAPAAPTLAADAAGDAADDNSGDDNEPVTLDAALDLVETARQLWAAGDRDKAIETLDKAYAALLAAPMEGGDKEAQQREDLRFLISRRLTEIYSTRFTKATGTHNEIPLMVNDHVEREIKLFQGMERDFFIESYRRSGRYREQMAKAFREAGMPEELSWLPLIESGFKVRALSRARALGLWQFIPSTGYKYGLKRTDWVDERLDPEKATAAAIAYLRELHDMFGDWATVLAAYNCGEGAVLRVIRNQKINYLDNFWDLYERLPRETARYYPRFLATLAIVKDPAKYGFAFDELEQSMPFETVSCEKPVQLAKLAEKIDCDADDLSLLNPELRYQATPPGSYALKVPSGKAQVASASIDSLPKYAPPKPAFVVHRVRRGETLSTIAVRYRTSVSRILEANNLRSGRLLRIGQKLKIPVRAS
ncbi:MAG: transglycosylase SLT domain-containing protein [Nitrospiraceae bacterium]|nr:transglycosylase SLT domain-containing protein [Nitrospiraceae bacterium]